MRNFVGLGCAAALAIAAFCFLGNSDVFAQSCAGLNASYGCTGGVVASRGCSGEVNRPLLSRLQQVPVVRSQLLAKLAGARGYSSRSYGCSGGPVTPQASYGCSGGSGVASRYTTRTVQRSVVSQPAVSPQYYPMSPSSSVMEYTPTDVPTVDPCPGGFCPIRKTLQFFLPSASASPVLQSVRPTDLPQVAVSPVSSLPHVVVVTPPLTQVATWQPHVTLPYFD